MFLQQGVSVVVAPITHDGNGQLLNTNADTMAAEIAIALAATRAHDDEIVSLHFVFEHHGVLASIDDPQSCIAELRADDVAKLIESGVVTKGMMPKISNALRASAAGVATVIQHVDVCGTLNGTRVV